MLHATVASRKMLDVELLYSIAAWIWVLLAFIAGVQGLRHTFAGAEPRSSRRALRFCISVTFLLAASAIIASAIVKLAVR